MNNNNNNTNNNKKSKYYSIETNSSNIYIHT